MDWPSREGLRKAQDRLAGRSRYKCNPTFPTRDDTEAYANSAREAIAVPTRDETAPHGH